MSSERLLLLMPTYNEELNITTCVEKWIPVVKSIPGSWFLIINDGSNDRTTAILNKLQKKYNEIDVVSKSNEGHGKTVRMGYEFAINSKFKWVFQTDSDGHFTPSDFFKLWDLRDSSPFILGYRKKREDTLFRKILTLTIRTWVNILFNIRIYDPNIPFRLIKISYLKQILPQIPRDIFAPNIFLSIIAARDGYKLYNVPIEHTNKHKKSNNKTIFKGALKGFYELLSFRPRKIQEIKNYR